MSRTESRRETPSSGRTHRKTPRSPHGGAGSAGWQKSRRAPRLRGWLAKTTLLALVLTAAAFPAAAQNGGVKQVGVGVIAGDPIGGTAKLWLDDDFAVDLGIGFSGDTVFWGDFLYHMWNLLPQPAEGKLGVYVGAGPRLEARNDAEFGVRTIAGVTWRLTRQPIELFAEAGPVFRMTPRGGVDADGGIGARFYFGSR